MHWPLFQLSMRRIHTVCSGTSNLLDSLSTTCFLPWVWLGMQVNARQAAKGAGDPSRVRCATGDVRKTFILRGRRHPFSKQRSKELGVSEPLASLFSG